MPMMPPPILSRKTVVNKLQRRRIRRKFGVCEEHLVERGFVRATERRGRPVAKREREAREAR
eukprot:2033915-Lingulodinium_polyedra.AAC.1